MGFFNEDMLPMLGVYEAETSELMSTLDGIVARVEQDKAFTPDDIAELFRCAHTIKGSSAMMGLDTLALLTHRVEDLFDLMRGDPTVAEGRIPDILDHLYAFSDYVRDELSRMSDDDYAPADAESMIQAVTAFAAELGGAEEAGEAAGDPAGGGTEEAGEAAGELAGGDAAAPSPAGTTLRVDFKPEVAMVNARALVILKQLKGQVQVLSHVPEDLANVEAARVIESDGLLVEVASADVDKAKRFLAKNSTIRRITALEVVAQAGSSARADGQAAESASVADKFVTLRWSDVSELQNLVGEFMLQESRLKALSNSLHEGNELRSAVSRATRLVDELVYRVDRMAMVSMAAMVPQLSRMVRDMCRNSGKQVSFEVNGGDIEIDRNLYNSISDPLLHIIRNAVDHGIELPEERLAAGKEARGKVTLSVESLGARVGFRIADDGCGIDTAKVLAKAQAAGKLTKPAERYTHSEILHMVMLPGLSTTDEVTQYSGRGVGMDVVSAVVRDFDGHVDIESEPGNGTAITLYLPVSVTSVQCLAFRIGPSVYHLPLFNLSKVYVADDAANLVSYFEGSALFEYKKRQIPMLDIHRVLACEGREAFYIVCRSMEDEFVIGVDEVLGEFSCANKPLPSCLGAEWQNVCPIRNAAIMDDGTVAYALHAAFLASIAQGRTIVDHAAQDESPVAFDAALDGATASDIPDQAFVFTLGDTRYAIPVNQVERLAPLPACSPTPRALPYLLGLANYRNKAVPVFDLAASAGVEEPSPYTLILVDSKGGFWGVTITAPVGVQDFESVVLADEQPAPRPFAADIYSIGLLNPGPKAAPVTLLAWRR